MPGHPPFPSTLRLAAECILLGHEPSSVMKEFGDAVLRGVMAAGRPIDGTIPVDPLVWEEAPAWLDDPIRRIYLGALAEHLAHMAGRRPPLWCQDPGYFLDDPVFPGGTSDREGLIARTPSAFRRRLLFCGPVMEKMSALLART